MKTLKNCNRPSLFLEEMERQENVWFHRASELLQQSAYSVGRVRGRKKGWEKSTWYTKKTIYSWYLNSDFHTEEKVETLKCLLQLKSFQEVELHHLFRGAQSLWQLFCSCMQGDLWGAALSILSAIQEKKKIRCSLILWKNEWKKKMFPSLVMSENSKYLRSSVLLLSIFSLLKNNLMYATLDSKNVLYVVVYTQSKKYIYRKVKNVILKAFQCSDVFLYRMCKSYVPSAGERKHYLSGWPLFLATWNNVAKYVIQ